MKTLERQLLHSNAGALERCKLPLHSILAEREQEAAVLVGFLQELGYEIA
jgi:hypothetical protein